MPYFHVFPNQVIGFWTFHVKFAAIEVPANTMASIAVMVSKVHDSILCCK